MFQGINLSRRRFLEGTATTIASTRFGAIASAKARSDLSPLALATTWLNSPALTADRLEGKVVLVEFWTYSCINWRRQLPFVRAWADKYKDHGLAVVGIHSPEFSFEKNIENIRWAAKDMRVAYPIAVDNDHAVWRGFNNEYWPALYFVDAKGKIRHHQFGEGEYEQSERVIQKLLAEAGAAGIGDELTAVNADGAEAAADWNDLRSGENYLGYGRTENFASSGSVPDMNHGYSVPAKLRLNQWALSGEWKIGRESILSTQPNGRIAYRFHARDLHLVMGPATTPGSPVKFRVLIDGHGPESAHGVDVDFNGSGAVVEQRMYQLIRQPAPIADRLFEIEFMGPGVAAFSFTFG